MSKRRRGKHEVRHGTHALVIDNGDFFDATKACKFIVQVSFLSTDAETEDAENIGGLRSLTKMTCSA
jgi:hypothetical protein